MDVIEQMADVGLTGLTEPDLMRDGVLHRFRPDWEPKAKEKRAWYVLFPFDTDSGNQLIAGSFGWFNNVIPDCSNDIQSFLLLHGQQHATIFFQFVWPPFDLGTTWSTVKFCDFTLFPQY